MFTTVKGYHMLLIPYAMNPFFVRHADAEKRAWPAASS
jgi:hypothetical protein